MEWNGMTLGDLFLSVLPLCSLKGSMVRQTNYILKQYSMHQNGWELDTQAGINPVLPLLQTIPENLESSWYHTVCRLVRSAGVLALNHTLSTNPNSVSRDLFSNIYEALPSATLQFSFLGIDFKGKGLEALRWSIRLGGHGDMAAGLGAVTVGIKPEIRCGWFSRWAGWRGGHSDQDVEIMKCLVGDYRNRPNTQRCQKQQSPCP